MRIVLLLVRKQGFTMSDPQQEKLTVCGEMCARARYQWKPAPRLQEISGSSLKPCSGPVKDPLLLLDPDPVLVLSGGYYFSILRSVLWTGRASV